MKTWILALTLFSGVLWAQQNALDVPTRSAPGNAPSYSQVYCAGFIAHAHLPRTNYVIGSKESPQEDRIPGRAMMFLGGPGLVEGERYSILRQVEDPNHEDSSPEQRQRLGKLGANYEEVGWVTVRAVDKGAAVASFDFACDTAVRGDIVVPFKEKYPVAFRPVDPPMSAFVLNPMAPTGHILGSRDFLALLGTGEVIYTDFGGAKGVRPGDYLMITRGYAPQDLNKIDRATEILPKGNEMSAVNTADVKSTANNHLPPHVLGEALVLDATPEASTALITRTFAEVEFGDVVSNENSMEANDDRPAVTSGTDAKIQHCHLTSRVREAVLHFHFHGCK